MIDDDELHHGIRFVHDLAMTALARAERAEQQLATLLEALQQHGALAPDQVAALRARLEQAGPLAAGTAPADADVPAAPSPAAPGSAVQQYQPAISISVSAAPDKHTVPSSDVDCAALLPLCHARCCRYRVQLSFQDVEDGLRWVYERPYELKREADGYCTHFDRDAPGCGVYHARPAPCRSYDCRDSPAIWIDFERRIPVPMEPPLFQIRRRPGT